MFNRTREFIRLFIYLVCLFLWTTHLALAGFTYDPDKEEVWVLSIDGGGVRGVIPAKILTQIEDELNGLYQRQEAAEQFRIGGLFDLVAGTSTGGIISLGLTSSVAEGRRPYSARELLALYENNGTKIFPPSGFVYSKLPEVVKGSTGPRFDPAGLEEVLEAKFGDAELKNANPHVLISSYDLRTRVPYWFDSLRAMQYPQENDLVKKIARATSAAPTHFKAANTKNERGDERVLADGGLTHNNPTWEAFQRAMKLYPKAKRYFILSLGTGEAPTESLEDKGDSGTLGWAPMLAGVMMGGASDDVHQSVSNQRSILEKLGITVDYKRIQPTLSPNLLKMDDPTKIPGLIAAVDSLQTKYRVIDSVLVRLRDRIQKTTGAIIPRSIHESQNMRFDSHILKVRRLERLDLSEESGLDDQALGLIKSGLSKTYPVASEARLMSLDLSNGAFSVDGLKIVADIITIYPSLTEVRLNHNHQLGDRGAKRLYEVLEGFSRSHLRINLEDVGLTRLGLRDLERLIEARQQQSISIEVWLGKNTELEDSLSTKEKRDLNPNIHFESLPLENTQTTAFLPSDGDSPKKK